MLGALLTTAVLAFASAFLPALPVEPYLVGAVATAGGNVVGIGVAAGLGQTLGKVTLFLAVRGSTTARWLPRWIRPRVQAVRERSAATSRHGVPEPAPVARSGTRARIVRRLRELPAMLTTTARNPLIAAAVILVSGLLGVPPLLLTTCYAAVGRMPVITFAATCLVARSARFICVAATPHLLTWL